MNRVVMLLRHLLSIAILPFTVAVLVPEWIREYCRHVGRILPRFRAWQPPRT